MIRIINRYFFLKTDLSYSAWVVNPHFTNWLVSKNCKYHCRNFYKL